MELAAKSDRPKDAKGITLTPLARRSKGRDCLFACRCRDRPRARAATVTVRGPAGAAPASVDAAHALGAKFWPLTVARELDDAILHLRMNEAAIGLVLFRTDGDAQAVLEHDDLLAGQWRLADARGPALFKEGVEARRRHRQELHRADRAGLLLCRHFWPNSLLPPTAR